MAIKVRTKAITITKQEDTVEMLTHTDLFDPVTLNMKGDVRIAISSYLQSQFN